MDKVYSIDELIYGNKRTNTVVHNHIQNTNVTENIGRGVGFGAVLAMIISYVKWESIGWAILHGILNWGYVIYYIIKYVTRYKSYFIEIYRRYRRQ